MWAVWSKRDLLLFMVPHPERELQVPLSHRGLSSLRKLKNIKKKHHKDFKTKGKGKLSAASSYKNCIHEPLLDLNISHVCPPYLHILLGIVKKHSDLLEEFMKWRSRLPRKFLCPEQS